ncbi:hypothetical protein EVAR_44366_1 [Eumeta japonica]|uniref:Uncharacterized protein n=1 Tax=Eumeta variegata TaxID=151549 RepID=A0A4C1X5R4_EUMVA|nr:hypothetical protein EVAR_44366_1 [Eumeta japonica]
MVAADELYQFTKTASEKSAPNEGTKNERVVTRNLSFVDREGYEPVVCTGRDKMGQWSCNGSRTSLVQITNFPLHFPRVGAGRPRDRARRGTAGDLRRADMPQKPFWAGINSAPRGVSRSPRGDGSSAVSHAFYHQRILSSHFVVPLFCIGAVSCESRELINPLPSTREDVPEMRDLTPAFNLLSNGVD